MAPREEKDDLLKRIEQALKADPDIDESGIEVLVEEGRVTLKGAVLDYWQKYRSEEIAAEQHGVLDVSNTLAVVPSKADQDREIAADVVRALRRNELVEAEEINVKVKDGIVTLTGLVHSPEALRSAEQVALYTDGVLDVNNLLEISF